MNLQLALDRLTKEQCFQIIKETSDAIDWIEVGTGVIKAYGMEIVREISEAYPEKTIVADMKTCDAGRHEAEQAFEAGADITTVMAFSADKTITDMLKVATKYETRVMVDLLGVTDKNRIEQLKELGVDLVSLHFGKDMQQTGDMGGDLFSLVQDIPGMEYSVAGGINLTSLPRIMKYNPDTVIVGSGITKHENRKEAALKMKEVIEDYAKHNQ
ncbi:3-hexulose-6-phosphate synthase [Halobacillus sp. MO56]